MINEENRVATALTIRKGNPDTIFLQEVENMISLKAFHDRLSDLNDYTETNGTPDTDHGLHLLLDNDFSFNLVQHINNPKERWTHYYQEDDTYHQLDYLLLSPALKDKNQNCTRNNKRWSAL